jgi:hypothetical protein
MMANSAVPGDSAVAPISSGPSTKRSRVSRKAKAPSTVKTKTAFGAPKAPARTKAVAQPRKTQPRKTQPRKTQPRKTRVRAQAEAPTRRTSEILRQILADNPQELISVDQIVKSLGATSFGTSLMVFSIPEVIPIPVPGMSAIVSVPTGLLGAQMVMGKGEIRLPKVLLKRSIPRKAFAAAVKAILPFLERAEKKVRPRWKWATSPAAKRFLGAFILVLACVIALPIPMTNMPAAIAIFVISLGLVERDGKVIVGGIVLGLASIALIGVAIAGLSWLVGGSI